MQQGIDNDWYNPHTNLEMLTFRFVFMPLVQQELSHFANRYNTSAKRSNTKTSLPAGHPKYIYLYPDQYDGEDLKVQVPPNALEEVRQLYAPPDHPVFQWLPPQFEYHARNFYRQVGGEMIVHDNAWQYYHSILDLFRRLCAGQVLQNELHLQGGIQHSLQALSETGSHRGDAWGYDEEVETGMELLHPVMEEGFHFDDDETPVVEFSDEEDRGGVVDEVF
ncbi:hypothetical protein FRC06_000916 [Ceratobasidium sp. 370]|nr:hypothetical protein FRC06_000916 [Ceratobasidium sp. 370]